MVEQESASSRGVLTGAYFLLTPDNIVPNALPRFTDTVVHPMATPRSSGARFGQYLLVFGPGGRSELGIARGYESFLFQLDGEVLVHLPSEDIHLTPHAFCYLPEGLDFSLEGAASSSTTYWTKRRYESVSGLDAPAPVFGRLADLPAIPDEVPGVSYRELLPAENPSYDMAMNVISFEPGASLGQVEIHHQEHGLLLLSGQGLYFLAGDFREVSANDYIYISPYCPQNFYATGREPSSYLLYKDVNRDGF